MSFFPPSDDIRRPRKRTPRTVTAKPRKSPERAIQVALVRLIRKHCRSGFDAVFYAVPNGGYRHIRAAMKFRAEGVERGAPDLAFVLKGGRAGFLELKADKGRPSDDQLRFRDHALQLGARWAIAYSLEEAVKILGDWGVLPFTVAPTTHQVQPHGE